MDKENRPQMISPDFLLSIKTAKFIRESNKDKHYDIGGKKKNLSKSCKALFRKFWDGWFV